MLYQIFILLCCPFLSFALEDKRLEKSFSLFSVLKWKNSACQAVSDTTLQGVCYTQQECDDLGGTADGNCAAGFGTCCIVTVSGTTANPGGTVTQNCTFIENVDFPSAEANTATYTYTVTKCSTEICQIRLDFLTANLAQPTAGTGVCTGDTFAVTAGGGGDIPTLCGELSGQHMYFDAGITNSAGTVTINTNTANAAGGTKSWRIKVSQIECSSSVRAPNGCLQYYLENVNTISSFNWDGLSTRTGTAGGTLASVDYRACIRQNKGMCTVEWSPATVTAGDSFDLPVLAANQAANGANAQHQIAGCASITAAIGTLTAGESFVQIPGAVITNSPSLDTFCGSQLSSHVSTAGTGAAVSSAVIATGIPFDIRYVAFGNQGNQAGFSLQATQVPCGARAVGAGAA